MDNLLFFLKIGHIVKRIHTPQIFSHTVVTSVLEAFLFSVFQFPALQSAPGSNLPNC